MNTATERKLTEKAIKESEERFRATFEQAAVGIAHVSPSGKWIRLNQKFCEITGYTHEELMGLSFQDITHPDDLEEDLKNIEPLLQGEIQVFSRDKRYVKKDGSTVWINLTVSLVWKSSGEPDYFITVVKDISARKLMEERQRLSLQLLEYISQSDHKTDMIKGITSLIKEFAGFESVGIRLRNGEDYPYYHTSGFPTRFVEAESPLCARDSSGAIVRDPQGRAMLECMCGNVISGRTHTSMPCFTPGGSFWTNSTSELLASTSEEDKLGWARNRCNFEGYESVALIPFRSGGETVGILQLNDRRRDMLTPEAIVFMEGIASSVGIAVHRKQSEESLRKERDNAQRYFDMAGTALLVIGEDQQVSLINRRGCEILGYEEDEIRGKNWFDNFIPEGLRENIKMVFNSLMRGEIEPVEYFENPVLDSTGQERIIAWHNTVLRDESGRIYATLGSGEDITERKRAEKALRESEARWRSFLANAPDIIFVTDRTGIIQYINYAPEGLTAEDAIGTNVYGYVPEDYHARLRQSLNKVFETGEPQTFDIMARGPQERPAWYITRVGPIKQNDKVVSAMMITSDITVRKQAEDALIEREEKICLLLDSTAEGIYGLDTDGNCTFCNSAALRFLGYDRADSLIGRNMHELIHHSYEDGTPYNMKDCPICRAYSTGEHVHVNDDVLWRSDGSYFHTEYWSYPIKKDKGIIGAVVTFMDITQRKKADELYSSIVRTAQDAFLLCDIDANIIDVNDAACQLYGYSREEFIGKHPRDLEALESPEEVALHTKRMQESGGDLFETKHRTNDGRIINVEVSIVFLPNLGGMTFSFVRDISERKEMEEERLRAQKFETIALLAGGIAHDFNNILTIIKNNLSLARMYTCKGGVVYEKLSEALEEFSQASSLTKQLLTFSKGRSPVGKATSIDSMLSHSVMFSLRGSNVRPIFNMKSSLPMVRVDKDQFSQVINNLIINSIHSMPGGGTVNISVDKCHVTSKDNAPLSDGEYVKISIADKGNGIPEEVMERIFDPYFTTKKEGHGFGLSTCYTIIRNHSGHISVESEQGKGTTFHIYLPASGESGPVGSLKAEDGNIESSDFSVTPLQSGIKGRVLIMDDEWKILKSMGGLLGLSGYRVNYAADGERAIRLYEESRGTREAYDVVVMDLTVPGAMGGVEALKRIRQLDPDAKAIVSSGYSSESIMSRYHEYGFDGAVAKPYDIEYLVRVIDSLLLKRPGVQGGIKHE